MLNFILGKKGSGKTTTAHRIAGEKVKQGKKVTLIVPKQFTFQSDKGILELLGPKDACEVEVLSFSRLACLVLNEYGGITKPKAGDGAKSILMCLTLTALSEKLKVFSRHKNEIALTSKLLESLDEMKKEGVTPGDLENIAKETADSLLKEKLNETALIIRTFDTFVSEKYFDDGSLLSFVADTLKGKDFFKGQTVILDGFSAFTKPERDIILNACLNAENVYVTLCCDEIMNTDLLSPFALCRDTGRKLLLLAGNNGIETGETVICKRDNKLYAPELFHLENEIYKPTAKAFDKSCDNVTVITAPSILHECDTVARTIKRLIREGKYRCRDITVIYRSGEKYEKHMKNALKRYEVPLFEDKRQNIENQPLVSFVSSLLLICSGGFNSDYIFRLLKTGLFSLSFDEISAVENYCFMWDIKGKMWQSVWTENPDGLGESFTDERKEALESLNKLRERIISPLSLLREQIKDKSGSEAVRLLYNFLRENGIDRNLKNYAISLEESGLIELALEQEQVWDILMESFDELGTVLGESVVSVSRLQELFTVLIKTKSLGKLPDGFDEVMLSTADRATTVNSPVAFVMGLNSGVFPASASFKGIFSAREKDSLNKGGITLGDSLQTALKRERYLLYNALSCCKNELYLSYSTSGSGGEKLTKSEGIDLVEAILPSHKKLTTQDDIDLIESEQSAFEYLSAHYGEKKSLVLSLNEYFKDKEEYTGRLEAIERAVNKRDFAFKDSSNAVALFGEDMYFSASKLEDYGRCPFLFFCRYGLKAKKRTQAKLNAAQSGTVIHYVLEQILKKYRGEELLNLTDEKLQIEIFALLKAYMDESMGSDETKTERFNYLYYRTAKILDFLVLRLKLEFAESDFSPCAFEFKIGKGSDVEPMVTKLNKGTAQLTGYIDRVDVFENEKGRYIRIVDYKSGEKKFRLCDVLGGMNMQMLLYLISIRRQGKGFYENIIPAGVLYFPARLSPFEGQRGDSSEARLSKRLSTGKMSGMLVSDGDVISHMEKGLKGVFIPAKLDEKKGVLKGDFITLEQLDRLSEKMDDIIREMGNSLHEGLVPARPVCGGSYTDVCSYCDYGDICLSENPEKRYIITKTHDESIRELMGGEKSGT
ncbi:MAG: PD-(D/E)XK nuclease family protein [Acutalibacteraceae bacterium]